MASPETKIHGGMKTRDGDDNAIDIALHSHDRFDKTLATISHLDKWTNADTASFDCMHYEGDDALEHCASKLNLQPGQRVLDVGSGYSATGRYLAAKKGVHVTGIEMQGDIHELAQRIIARNVDERVVKNVSSVHADFCLLEPHMLSGGVDFDGAIALMSIMHTPQQVRRRLFEQMARYATERGAVYIEDFYRCADFTADEESKLKHVVGCSHIPTSTEWISDIKAAGFMRVDCEDRSERWTRFVIERAQKYKHSEDCDPYLERFYDTVAEVFLGGNLGGIRLTAQKG